MNLSAGIVQFRIQVIFGDGIPVKRKRQISTTADIIESVSCSCFSVYTGSSSLWVDMWAFIFFAISCGYNW